LWSVDDAATGALMIDFYKARATGASNVISLYKSAATLQNIARWKHPYYWGAFVLLGCV
jgi:CHAT domain-containing protein